MKRGIPQKTKRLTASALLAAMGVALLFMGSFIETLDLSMAALASFFCLFAVVEFGGIYPWLIFAVTGILAVIARPESMGGWFYILFFGYYPIIKDKLQKFKKPLAWTLKILLLNAALAISLTIACFLLYGGDFYNTFMMTFGDEGLGLYAAIGTYLLLNVTFVVYDIALNRLVVFYYVKIRNKFKFLK